MMSFLDVYVGHLEDPNFHWDDGDNSGNIPKRRSEFFPGGRDPFRLVVERIESGQYDGQKTDWAGWVARMYPAEITAFLDEVYVANDPEVTAIRQYVQSLNPRRQYALVASEL